MLKEKHFSSGNYSYEQIYVHEQKTIWCIAEKQCKNINLCADIITKISGLINFLYMVI